MVELRSYLRENDVDFRIMEHEEYYTAQEEAAAGHLSGGIFAKTVLLCAGPEHDHLLLVLPASYRVDLDAVKELLETDVSLASEDELAEIFDDCEVGAEPPFGSQYGLRTIIDEHLAEQERIAMRACNHHEVIVMSYADFAQLECPEVARFAMPE